MNNFKVARKEKEYSQEAVARMLGVTTQAYGRYENGQRECSYSTLLQLSAIFGCTIDYLLGNAPAQPVAAPALAPRRGRRAEEVPPAHPRRPQPAGHLPRLPAQPGERLRHQKEDGNVIHVDFTKQK